MQANKLADHQVKHMMERFLRWKLPENFRPDGGVSFASHFTGYGGHVMKNEPSGTNLFDAIQAEAMIRFMIEDLPE